MANVFANLPLPALNGAGVAVDVSTQGVPKTVEVVGSFRGATIAVEGSTDGGVTYAPICVFQDVGGKKVLDVVVDHMRVNVRGRKSVVPFSANCDVGAPEDAPVFASIAIPASNGAGAATDISAFGDTITIVCGGTFRGAVVAFEISEDGVDYAPLFSFAGQGGIKSAIVTASFVRARVSGRRSSAPFSATASVGGVQGGGGGGGGSSTAQRFQYTVVGSEPDLSELVIALPAGRADALYLVFVTMATVTDQLGLSVANASRTPTQFVLSLSSPAQAGDIFSFLVDDPA